MMPHRPETNNEKKLRDVRAAEEIHHVQHQGSLQANRTAQVADTRSAAQNILTQAANTDMHMSMHHDRIRSTKVEQLEKKRKKLEKDEEKYRGLVNVAWIAFPVTMVVYVFTCCHCCLPDLMKERKRNTQRKIKAVDAELLALTNVNVRRNWSISDSVSATDEDRRFTGTADPHVESVYAAHPPVSTITTTTARAPISTVTTTATCPSAPPDYHEYMSGVKQVHVQ
ncbi:unnamed protein product [Ectocarpus sp. 12 AP-2014]